MSTGCIGYLILALFSLLPDDCETQEKTPKYIDWDLDTMYDMEKDIYTDLKRKAQSVMYMRSRFKRQLHFYIGQSAFVLRRLYSQLMHLNHRGEGDKKRKYPAELIHNVTSCVKFANDVRLAVESVHEYNRLLLEKEKKKGDSNTNNAGRNLRKYQLSRNVRKYMRSLDLAGNNVRLQQLFDESRDYGVTAPLRKVSPKPTNVKHKHNKNKSILQ